MNPTAGTPVLAVNPDHPDPAAVRRAAAVIRAGGLVAFPTETVYGLGANALNPAAVARVFEAKGRPPTNPLIVHVAGLQQVISLAASWPGAAYRLAGRFWPGPLTLVVPRRPVVPDAVTAGGPTVAVRWPASLVALELIAAAGVPLAAPSANRSTELSPTQAAHVLKGLNGRIDLLLDGGPCAGGLESTVVDVSGPVPRVLRPGPITVPLLEEVVGRVEVGPGADAVARSPGQMAKHYSPRTPVALGEGAAAADRLCREFVGRGLRVAAVGFGLTVAYHPMPFDPQAYAANLYAVLHELDTAGYDRIVVELPPDRPEWAAARDRLARAAAEGG